MLLRQQKDQDVYRRFRKTCCFNEICDSGILRLLISVIYLTIEMHLNIAINTSVSMQSDLKVCRLTKNEFKYMFLIIWRPQQCLVLFKISTLFIFLFWSFNRQNHLLYPCPNLIVQDFMKKSCSDAWIVLIKYNMKVAAGKLMHTCSGLLWLSGTCFFSSKTYFLHVLYLHTYWIHIYCPFLCIVPPYTDLVNIKSSNWTRPMCCFLTCPCTCMSPWH